MTDTQVPCEREDRLAEVVDEFFDAVARGELPDISVYLRRYPEIADLLKVVIPAMLATEQRAAQSEPATFRDAISQEKRLGDFRILRQIGRGGMGIVYEAEQISMKRRIALKVLPLAGLVDELKIHRFQNEVRAVAALNHPNIVPVYMVGQERGVHYYAMQLIHGRNLSDVIASLQQVRHVGARIDGTSISQVARIGQVGDEAAAVADSASESVPSDFAGQAKSQETLASANSSTIPHSSSREYYRSVAALGIQAAAALQHAHEHGVLHRDIKPANLLLDGSATLFVTDFGLARIESDVGVTMTGDLVGTLRYMAPEQALAKRVVVDHRADIYSLGATLYELLTLQPAYRAQDRQQLLKQIAFEEPTPLRRLDPQIPTELQTIVHKAMSKDRNQRYASAQDLADDLRLHLENRPIKARPPTTFEIISKWTRRNPILIWATIITLTLVSITLAASTLLIVNQRDIARKAHIESASRAREMARRVYLMHIANADSALLEMNYSRARTELDACPQEHRGWEWHYLVGNIRATIPQRFPGAEQPIFSRDGHRLIAIGALGTPGQRMAHIWDLASGDSTGTLEHESRLSHISMSPDEKRIAGGDYKGHVFVWDVATGKKLWTIATVKEEHAAKCNGLTFSPDGKLIASANGDESIKFFDATSGNVEFTSSPRAGPFRKVMFSPDGRWLAAGSERGQTPAILIDVNKREIVATFPGEGHMIPTFAPSGRQIATSNLDGSITLWDWDGEQPTVNKSWQSEGMYVWALDFSADGDRLVSGDIGNGVKVWDVATGQELAALDTGQVGALWLATGPRDDEVAFFTVSDGIRLWHYHEHDERMTVKTVDGAAVTSFSPDGQLIAVSIRRAGLWVNNERRTAMNQGDQVSVLDAASGTNVLRIGEDLHSAAWTPDGRHIVAVSDPQREIRIHRASTGQLTRVFTGETSFIGGFALSARNLDLVFIDGTIRMLDRHSGDSIKVPTDSKKPGSRQVIGVGMSPINARVAVAFYGSGLVEVWDARTRALVRSFTFPGPTVGQIVFSKDGSSLYVGGAGGRLVWFDIDSGQETKRFNGHSQTVSAIAISPDEDQIVSGDGSGRVIVWDAAIAQPLVTLAEAGQFITSLDWSSDGRRIVAGKVDGTVQIWTLPRAP